MRRREFITFLGGAAAWPLVARAQQRPKLPTVGILGGATPATWSAWLPAFIRRLAELGWIEGRTVAIEYRWAGGSPERAAELAAEFVRLKVDVILTAGGVLAGVKPVTSVIPIVFAVATDPVGAGFAASLARPGGNLTGLSLQTTDYAAKRVELLHEFIPTARSLAILVNSSNPGVIPEMREAETAIRALGLLSSAVEIRRGEDIAPAFAAIKGRADALYVCSDVLVNVNRVRINTLALGARLPTMYSIREYGGRRSDVLRTRPRRPVPACRRLRRQDSARGEACGPADRAADQVRVGGQSDDSQDNRLDNPAGFSRTRRRGDRVM